MHFVIIRGICLFKAEHYGFRSTKCICSQKVSLGATASAHIMAKKSVVVLGLNHPAHQRTKMRVEVPK
jgi:hypothetical protein